MLIAVSIIAAAFVLGGLFGFGLSCLLISSRVVDDSLERDARRLLNHRGQEIERA